MLHVWSSSKSDLKLSIGGPECHTRNSNINKHFRDIELIVKRGQMYQAKGGSFMRVKMI
jgi:hypothetical protein